MSAEYDIHLKKHRTNVWYSYQWIVNNLNYEQKLEHIFPDLNVWPIGNKIFMSHDSSKYDKEEYDPCDEYFYGNGKITVKGQLDFERAWLHHVHCNSHHWQYWIVIRVDPDDTTNCCQPIDIPDDYIVEMVSDWWSFSWEEYLDKHDRKELYGIFDHYNEYKDKMILSDKTRFKVESLLKLIKDRLDSMNDE